MPGKRHPPEIKEEGIVLANVLSSSLKAGVLIGVPDRTVRQWVAEFRVMGDSELEAFIADQKRLAGGLWAAEQIAALEFAEQLRVAGQAKAYLSAMTAAGIASTKLESLGLPRNVTPSAARTASNELIAEFGRPSTTQGDATVS